MKKVQVLPGLNAITGDEGSGKTQTLRQLCENESDAIWLDLRLPEHDELTPEEFWALQQNQSPHWNQIECTDLCNALNLTDHLGKRLFMLSAGSRRKVALIALLSSGARIVCLDQPFAALDQASIAALCDYLNDMSNDPGRSWVVADYEADPRIHWAHVVSLDPM
jgi:ABC-type multidrug transport system ATPase subunit